MEQLIFFFDSPAELEFQRRYRDAARVRQNRAYYRRKGKCGCGKVVSPGLKCCPTCIQRSADYKARKRKEVAL